MKLFVLQGADGCGKSETLRVLIRRITGDPNGSFVCENDRKRFERACARQGDISLPVLFRGRLIAITTCGDAPSLIRPFYENHKRYADVFVCASHPEGTAIYRYVDGLRAEGHTVAFIQKTEAAGAEAQEKRNRAQADELFEIIRQEITGKRTGEE